MRAPSPWTARERAVLARLSSPARVQYFLDSMPYSADPFYRCPRAVLRDRKAHCFDGAVFAAAALRGLGFQPLLVDLGAVRDDDHVLAVYRRHGGWGAVSKSNFAGLRYREPLYRSVRDLVLSYFEVFYNLAREKTLRTYSRPVDLARFDRLDWLTSDEAMETIAQALDRVRHYPLLTAAQVRALVQVDKRSYEAGLRGANRAGLYQP